MIPQSAILEWKRTAPWKDSNLVEQDLCLCRAIVELFSDTLLSSSLAFRGGTALYKLFMDSPARYSEDIDLVQTQPGPIGPILDAVQRNLGPWLGKAKRDLSRINGTLTYRFESEIPPITSLRVKIEINTREHFHVLDLVEVPFSVTNPWFSGQARIITYQVEELLGTKLRALYQRKKGRDLFDLNFALSKLPDIDPRLIVECFQAYLKAEGHSIDRLSFEHNLSEKMTSDAFKADLGPLLSEEAEFEYNMEAAYRIVLDRLAVHLS